MACVLLIEDSESDVRAISQALRDAGYHSILTAVDWSQCRHVLANNPPQLVVVDAHLHLPGMVTGEVLARQIRKDPRAGRTKIVFYGSMDERELADMARRNGVDSYVSKGDLRKLVQVAYQLAPPV